MGDCQLMTTHGSSAVKESAYNTGDCESGRSPGEGIGYPLQYSWASLEAQMRESARNAGDLGSIPELGRSPGERNGYPALVFWPGGPHGQRSLVGCGPWCCKE